MRQIILLVVASSRNNRLSLQHNTIQYGKSPNQGSDDGLSLDIHPLPATKSTGEDNLQLSEDRTRHHGQGTLQEVGRY